jgi:putative membrane protein
LAGPPEPMGVAVNYVLQNWSFDPFVVVVAFVVLLHELGLANLRRRSTAARTRTRRLRSLFFYGGLALLLITVTSPVDYWSSDYLFVHMIEHIFIAFYAPLLIVAGAPWLPLVHGLPVGPRRAVLRAFLLGRRSRSWRALGRFVTNPWTALLAFNATMVLWHLPAAFDFAEQNQLAHIWLMHASLFVTGMLFWLQLVPSYPFRMKAEPFWQIGAILSTNVVMFVLAMSMSLFTDTSWYSVYAHVPGVTLSPYADQQIGAAVLWVCGDFWAIPALAVAIRRAMDSPGGFSLGVDRLLHHDPSPTLEGLRTSTVPSSPVSDGASSVAQPSALDPSRQR